MSELKICIGAVCVMIGNVLNDWGEMNSIC